MDVAYNQHSPFSRHHSHSHANLGHLTLAPLTSRLPLSDEDALESIQHISYIEGRSAPTTPSILSRTSSRVALRKPKDLTLPKSKSSTHLSANKQHPRSANKSRKGEDLRLELSANDRSDSDWLLRAGASISTSARESKGQAWLVSRASSTSLTGQRDEEDEQFERELAKEREQRSRRASRRSSIVAFDVDADDEFSPITRRRSLSFGPATGGSRPGSRFGSRSRGNSRRGSRAQLFTPLTSGPEGYFDQGDFTRGDFIAEPDFVDAEEQDDGTEDNSKLDEAVIRKLARASSLGLGGWVEKMLGWSLFAVDEDGEDTEVDAFDEKGEDSSLSSRPSRQAFENDVTSFQEVPPPPPLRDEEAGGWQDAAWLLSVATKVLL